MPDFKGLLAALALVPGAALAQEAAGPAPTPAPVGMVEQPCPPQQGLWFGHPLVKQQDWPWLCHFQADNAAVQVDSPVAVFMGDSITQNWIATDKDLFSHGNIDRGIGGQTSPQMLLRFWQDVVSLKPQVVHIMAGTNDIAGNTGPNSPQDFQNNIKAMVALAKANGIAVVLGSIPPADRFGWRPELKPAAQIIALNAWLKDFAAANGLIYADYHSALADANGGLPAQYGSDGVHPNAAGYAVMRPIAERAIAQALEAAKAQAIRRFGSDRRASATAAPGSGRPKK